MCSQNSVSNPFLSHSCRFRSINIMWASQREQASVWSVRSVCQIKIFVLFELFVFKKLWASQREQRSVRSVRSVCKKIFVTFALLPPYGQWAYGESRVQNISWEHRNSSLVNSTLRPAATIQHSTFKTQHCAPRLRVQKNIRVIRFIRVQNNSCSKSAERDLCAINIRLILL